MNNFTGFGYQAFGFCPRGHLIFIRFLIYSWKRQWKFDSTVKHHLLVLNRQRRNYNFYSIQLQFLWCSKSVEASTRQPESHHRVPVVFVQPTPSLEGVLDSRRIYFYFQSFFKLPYKRNDVYIFFQIGESSRALFLQHVRRPFNHKPESHHRMSHNINCCLCSNSYIENLKLLSAIYHVEALISEQT